MVQKLEIYRAKAGVSADELREVLKYGEKLIGPDYLARMKEVSLWGDVSFVAEMEGGVYLISYYLFEKEPKPLSAPLESIPSLKKYMERIKPLFEGSQPIRIGEPANSFWIDCAVAERLG